MSFQNGRLCHAIHEEKSRTYIKITTVTVYVFSSLLSLYRAEQLKQETCRQVAFSFQHSSRDLHFTLHTYMRLELKILSLFKHVPSAKAGVMPLSSNTI